MDWYGSDQDYHKKRTLVLRIFDRAVQDGYTVSLIGESAGASMALNVAALRPVFHRVITIAGLNDTNTDISPSIRKRSPSFLHSVRAIGAAMKELDTSRVHTIRGLADFTVYARHTRIDGAHNHIVLGIGHLVTIGLCLTLFAPYIVTIIKRGY